MTEYREKLDTLFVEDLGYEIMAEPLPIPEDIDGVDNIIDISKEYSGKDVDVIFVECKDKIFEFEKKLIRHFKSYFPNSYFLFISNKGKVIDIFNVSTSKQLKAITYNELEKNTSLFKEKNSTL